MDVNHPGVPDPDDYPKLVIPMTDNFTFDEWIGFQAQLQRVGGKGDPIEIEDREELRDFVTAMAFAASGELHEMADEMGWKPWDDERGLISPEQRIRAIMEGVDALHFLGNLFRVLNATGEEITAAYKAKAQKNLKRWQEGYDARATKCPGCGRDFEESDCVPGEFCIDVGHEVQDNDTSQMIDDPATPGHAIFDTIPPPSDDPDNPGPHYYSRDPMG